MGRTAGMHESVGRPERRRPGGRPSSARPIGRSGMPANEPIRLPQDFLENGFWRGRVDEVALFNRALSSKEIAIVDGLLLASLRHEDHERPGPARVAPGHGPGGPAVVGPAGMARGLLLRYSFDSDSGGKVLDRSGGNRHAGVHGATYDKAGVVGGAMRFDGEDDYLEAPKIRLESFTFSAFVKTFGTGKAGLNNRRLFLLHDGPRYYALQGNAGGAIGLNVTGHREVNEYNWAFEADKWTHIAVTYATPTVRIYRDGRLTETGRLDTEGVAGQLFIGGDDKHYGRFWHGMMDEVMLFSRALSAAEVEALQKPGTSRGHAPARGGERFVGTWRGLAVDKPGQGTSRDRLILDLRVSGNGRLAGTASGRFPDSGWAELEKLQVTGGRLTFEVPHRTGVRMAVTLRPANAQLVGEGIPIDSDEDECDIELDRVQPPRGPRSPGTRLPVAAPAKVLATGEERPRIRIYLVTDAISTRNAEKMPLAKLKLRAEPIVSEKDIVGYDWDKHALHLTAEARMRLPRRPGVWGVPFVVVVEGRRWYLGAFWTAISSYAPRIPVSYTDGTVPRDKIHIRTPQIGPQCDPVIRKGLETLRRRTQSATPSAAQPTGDTVSLGTLRVGPGVSRLSVTGPNGAVFRDVVGGIVQLPRGSYHLNHWDMERKDDTGASWKLTAMRPAWKTVIEVKQGPPAPLDIPGSITASVSMSRRGRACVFSNPTLKGPHGERIMIPRNGRRQWSPKLRIRNADGSYNRRFTFRFG